MLWWRELETTHYILLSVIQINATKCRRNYCDKLCRFCSLAPLYVCHWHCSDELCVAVQQCYSNGLITMRAPASAISRFCIKCHIIAYGIIPFKLFCSYMHPCGSTLAGQANDRWVTNTINGHKILLYCSWINVTLSPLHSWQHLTSNELKAFQHSIPVMITSVIVCWWWLWCRQSEQFLIMKHNVRRHMCDNKRNNGVAMNL